MMDNNTIETVEERGNLTREDVQSIINDALKNVTEEIRNDVHRIVDSAMDDREAEKAVEERRAKLSDKNIYRKNANGRYALTADERQKLLAERIHLIRALREKR